MERTIVAWPDNKKLVVMVTIMFEVWSNGKAPPYSPMTTSLKPGTPDLLGISWSQYGGKTGIWRFLRILDETQIKATICLNAKGAELFPEAVQQAHRHGHEIAGHSYTQDLVLPYLSAMEEREVIQRCKRIITDAVGIAPVGWFSPVAAPTANTAAETMPAVPTVSETPTGIRRPTAHANNAPAILVTSENERIRATKSELMPCAAPMRAAHDQISMIPAPNAICVARAAAWDTHPSDAVPTRQTLSFACSEGEFGMRITSGNAKAVTAART